MSYRDWPKVIGGNEFTLAKLNPDEPPAEMKVVTWSNVFGKGGRVAIEGYRPDKERYNSDFGSISIERDGSVQEEREHLQDLLDDFLVDLEFNWRALIESARASVASFYAKQAAEYAEKAAAAAKGVFS